MVASGQYNQSMARRTRCSDAGYVYHVLNRAVGRATLFDKPSDSAAFEKLVRKLGETWGHSGFFSQRRPFLAARPRRSAPAAGWGRLGRFPASGENSLACQAVDHDNDGMPSANAMSSTQCSLFSMAQ
jgi:hypothetical protein